MTLLILIYLISILGSEKTQNVVDIREGFYFRTTNPYNQFPEQSDLPGFADTLRCYTEQVTRLG